MTERDFEVLAKFVSKYSDAIVYDLMGTLMAAYPNFNDHEFMTRVEFLRHNPSAAPERRPPGAR